MTSVTLEFGLVCVSVAPTLGEWRVNVRSLKQASRSRFSPWPPALLRFAQLLIDILLSSASRLSSRSSVTASFRVGLRHLTPQTPLGPDYNDNEAASGPTPYLNLTAHPTSTSGDQPNSILLIICRLDTIVRPPRSE